MHSMNMSKSDCATQTYFRNGKKHDLVKHLRLCISDWTRRLKSDESYRHANQQLRSAEVLHRRKQHDQVSTATWTGSELGTTYVKLSDAKLSEAKLS